MGTKYIIKFCKNIETIESYIDGFVVLKSNPSGHNIIEVRTCTEATDASNRILFHKFITNNFATVTFDDITMKCFLEYNNFSKPFDKTNPMIKSVISFDKSSASAYTSFKKTFTEMTNTQNETVYYPSGRIRYIGEVIQVDLNNLSEQTSTCGYFGHVYNYTTSKLLAKVAHGTGTWYYDNFKLQVKYQGEWENGKIDGAGIFYSYDGKMFITANNISSGIPIGMVKLTINFNQLHDIQTINITDFLEKFCTCKESRANFVSSNHFVGTVAKCFLTSSNSIEQMIFQEQSNEDKQVELWHKINELSERVNKLSRENYEQAEKTNKQITKQITNIICMASLTVIFTQTLLYMLK